jgi:Domain of unknown function (DUF4159)
MKAPAAAILSSILLVVVGGAAAQFGGQIGRGRIGRYGAPPRFATPDAFDGRFNFCRIVFRQNPYGDGNGWGVDYPRADQDLSIRLSELTKAPVSFDREGNPIHFLVRLTDDELFHCPFIMMTEVGGAYFDDREAARLRDYLLKGGFLWADDFWGSHAWQAWESQIRKVLPAKDFAIADLPIEHPMFHTLFDVQRVPQIPSIDSWQWLRGGTSERGADSATVHARAIFDSTGRMMVFITHNTDFGDAWEREADDPNYFYRFSVDGYAVGIDLMVYAMTH